MRYRLECISNRERQENAIQCPFRAVFGIYRAIIPAAGKLSPAPVARKRGHNAPRCLFRPAGNIETCPAPPGAVCGKIVPILSACPCCTLSSVPGCPALLPSLCVYNACIMPAAVVRYICPIYAPHALPVKLPGLPSPCPGGMYTAAYTRPLRNNRVM